MGKFLHENHTVYFFLLLFLRYVIIKSINFTVKDTIGVVSFKQNHFV